MATDTRIQDKSRVAKKVIEHGQFDANGNVYTYLKGKKTRPDLKGYPQIAGKPLRTTEGIPYPVLTGVDFVDTTP